MHGRLISRCAGFGLYSSAALRFMAYQSHEQVEHRARCRLLLGYFLLQ